MNKLYLIGNAHLDPVWLWDWREGFGEIRATFRSALDRIREFDDFIFTSSSAVCYQWIEQLDPAMFEEIRQRVKQGRWVLCGGWWLQPDCNLPCGESFIRHSLIGQRYFRDKFGAFCTVGYNVDSFGHAGCLPQILKKSGMHSYVFMRPSPIENGEVPLLFNWKGNDGTTLPAFHIHQSYNNYFPDGDFSDKIMAEYDSVQSFGANVMCFFGVGNHGGGPTIQNIRDIHVLQQNHDIEISAPTHFFAYTKVPADKVYAGSLLHHAIGCYSANSRFKRMHQKTEQALLRAEKFISLSSALTGIAYPRAELEHSWKQLLLNQFHDTLGGCSIEAAYEDGFCQLGEAVSIADRVETMALQRIAIGIDTLDGGKMPNGKEGDWRLWQMDEIGTPLVLFNPHEAPLQVPIALSRKADIIRDPKGQILPIQHARGEQVNGHMKYDTLFMAQIPPMGYAVYRAELGDAEERISLKPVEQTGLELQNSRMRIKISDKYGMPKYIGDCSTGENMLSGVCRMTITDDSCNDTWAHGALCFEAESGEFQHISSEVTENGPVRSVIHSRLRFGESAAELRYLLYKDCEYLEVDIRAHWRESRKILRLNVPCNFGEPRFVHALPFGMEEKPCDGGEQPIGPWSCLTQSGGNGIAIAQKGVFSGSARASELRLTLLRSAYYADHFGETDSDCRAMDQGEHRFVLRISLCKQQDSFSAVERMAASLLQPPVLLTESFHDGALLQSMQGISVSSPHVRLSACKRHTDGNGFVLRFVNMAEAAQTAEVSAYFLARSWRIELLPFEIKTYFVPDNDNAPITEQDMTETPV